MDFLFSSVLICRKPELTTHGPSKICCKKVDGGLSADRFVLSQSTLAPQAVIILDECVPVLSAL